MNKYLIKRVLATNLIFLVISVVHAQDQPPEANPAFGPDSASRIRCAADLSTMSEYIKINLYDDALPAWRSVYNNCPAASKNIYISGERIFRKKIEDTDDPGLRTAYFDTLMQIFDRRTAYFGEEGYVLGRKGIMIIKYNNSRYDQAYEAFLKSMEISGPETELSVFSGLIQTGLVMMKAGKISESVFLENYLKIKELLPLAREKGASPTGIRRVSEEADKVVDNSGLRDCESIEKAFSDRLHSSETDPSLLEVASSLLTGAGCDNSEFYAFVIRKQLELSPDADKSYELARYEIKRENYPKAAEYLEQAISSETSSETNATYQYQLALILASKLGKYAEARDVAKLAIENRPGWADPYFVIASAYISGIGDCDADDFQRKAVYWLAVDYCNKARSADPSAEQKAGELISVYRSNFPSVEDTFFRSLKEGDPYRFDCWINESTSVKMK